jgi:hypothetical protein
VGAEAAARSSSEQCSRSHSSMGSVTAGWPNMMGHMYSNTRPLRYRSSSVSRIHSARSCLQLQLSAQRYCDLSPVCRPCIFRQGRLTHSMLPQPSSVEILHYTIVFFCKQLNLQLKHCSRKRGKVRLQTSCRWRLPHSCPLCQQ